MQPSEFGYEVFAPTLGSAWIELLAMVYRKGKEDFDEARRRRALENIRVKSACQTLPDSLIDIYASKENLEAMIGFTFSEDTIRDIDVVKSFHTGAKSYCKRIKEGKMMEFVIERLTRIPESKKAVMVFPTYEDYQAVMNNHGDDYLPCIVAVHFRLAKTGSKLSLNTSFFARSMDVFQKGPGNIISIAMLSETIARELQRRLKTEIGLGFLDGLIADGHIYEESLESVGQVISSYERGGYKPQKDAVCNTNGNVMIV